MFRLQFHDNQTREKTLEAACYSAAVRVALAFPSASLYDVYQDNVLLCLVEKERFGAIPSDKLGGYVYAACYYNALHKIKEFSRVRFIGGAGRVADRSKSSRDFARLERQKKAVLDYAHRKHQTKKRKRSKTTDYVELTLESFTPSEIAKKLDVDIRIVTTSLYYFARNARRFFASQNETIEGAQRKARVCTSDRSRLVGR